ncbi:MAG: ABC transporter permease [Nitrosomonas sp.]|nr:ABC transporter permease [Nitrosomonas sp.]MCC6915885.1 ABC transporter permease [Nitrosomonas sp.]
MSAEASADNCCRYRLITTEAGDTVLQLTGDFTLAVLDQPLPMVSKELAQLAGRPGLHWDLTALRHLDYAAAVMLWHLWGGRRPDHLLLRPEQERMFLRLETTVSPPERVRREWFRPVSLLGKHFLCFLDHLAGVITLTGLVVLDAVFLMTHPRRAPLREISAGLYRTGAQALGITALVGFLIGIVLSYLTSEQLHLVGADIYIINLLGLIIIRELGPMLAAVLVAGRSGSAITAQLGVMRVTEELDALTVMGIRHSMRLVLPKMIGLGIAMPLIVVWTSAIALLGGLMAADFQIELSIHYALTVLPNAVPIANLWLALAKGVVFGMAIALIACHFGLRIKPNTESLGEGTTSSVVASITSVILIDAVFAVAFSHIGLKIVS